MEGGGDKWRKGKQQGREGQDQSKREKQIIPSNIRKQGKAGTRSFWSRCGTGLHRGPPLFFHVRYGFARRVATTDRRQVSSPNSQGPGRRGSQEAERPTTPFCGATPGKMRRCSVFPPTSHPTERWTKRPASTRYPRTRAVSVPQRPQPARAESTSHSTRPSQTSHPQSRSLWSGTGLLTLSLT